MPIKLTTNKKPLFYKIDYGTIPQTVEQTMNGVNQTMSDFTNFRKSLGIFTDEEKQLAEQQARERWEQREKERKERLANLEANMHAAQQRFNEEGLWNSEDVYDVYNVYETDPVKQEEFRRNGETTAGILSTVATLPFTAGMMGWVPAITTTATGAVGGYAGAYGGQQLGQYLDNKYGTNTTPWLSTIGGVAGGILGGGLGYKGLEGISNKYLINKAFKSGQLKYGQPTSYTAYHQSATPITKFKFPFKERWDVRTHGADPNGAFFTVGEPAGSGFLAERPYTGQFQVKVQKPLIQTGELTGLTKNGLRNAIVKRARRDGADAVFFDGIADNTLQNQQILFATDNADIGYRGMVKSPKSLTIAERLGIPKGERNQLVKLGYRTEFPNDQIINAEPLKKEMLDLFASNVYRNRLIKSGYSDAQIDDFLKNRMQLGTVRKAPIAISSDVELGDGAHWYRNYVKMHPKTKDIDEAIFHELGHGSDFPGLYRDPRQPKITKLAFPGSKYYLDSSEIRTRGLGVLQWMQKHDKTIDDFYKPGNTDLNKRAQEFLIYYPEDQGRQYLSSFWKQGGKIENSN